MSQMIRDSLQNESALATHLLRRSETLSADAHYRLARIVARVLVSTRLRQRRKWCDLARSLASAPAVEERLVRQAISWLEQRGHGLYGK